MRDTKGPPQETGRRLATCERGELHELRVTMQEYQGHQYLDIRLWERGVRGDMWPAKGKGITVKLRELLAIHHAVGDAIRLANGEELPEPEIP